MKVKVAHNLQPGEFAAHSLVVEDDAGNPILAAAHIADGIVCASIADPDFSLVLRLVRGDITPPRVIEVPE
jgi:hypothetical protein